MKPRSRRHRHHLPTGVLTLSFSLLAIVPLRPFREIALATGLGLLINAFVKRTVLVPP